MAWRVSPSTKEFTKVYEETFNNVSIHHLGLDPNYIALMFRYNKQNPFDLSGVKLCPNIEFRSTQNFQKEFEIPHGLELVYELKFADGLLAVGYKNGVRIWNVETKAQRDITIQNEYHNFEEGVVLYGFEQIFFDYMSSDETMPH